MNMGIKVWILYNTSKVKALTVTHKNHKSEDMQ